MSTERELLRSSPLFREFPDDVIDRFIADAERRTYASGDVIAAEGETAEEVFMVLDGEVRIEVALANADTELPVITARAGDFMGEYAYIEEVPRAGTATAKTDVTVLVWKCEDWRRLAEEDLELAYALLKGIARQLCARLRTWHVSLLDNVSWGLE